jgi:hypothetical protein
MSHEELVERLTASAELRDEFRRNPDGVVERHGIELTEEQRTTLTSEDWSAVSDEELVARVSAPPGSSAQLWF